MMVFDPSEIPDMVIDALEDYWSWWWVLLLAVVGFAVWLVIR